jgi:hypothetical protein
VVLHVAHCRKTRSCFVQEFVALPCSNRSIAVPVPVCAGVYSPGSKCRSTSEIVQLNRLLYRDIRRTS